MQEDNCTYKLLLKSKQAKLTVFKQEKKKSCQGKGEEMSVSVDEE